MTMTGPAVFFDRVKRMISLIRTPERVFEADFKSDGLAVAGKNLSFLQDPAFKEAWAFSVELNKEGWRGHVPDVRWRAHVACWAAGHCLHVPGDFAEFGVHTGIFSLTICKRHDFARQPKNYYLYDTFNGIPIDSGMTDIERKHTHMINEKLYFDCFEIATRNFAHFPNTVLVRGVLPESINLKQFSRLAFVHIDLNNVNAEMGVIQAIWDRISPGGMVLLDDYCFKGYEEQYNAWNAFCTARGYSVLSLPTGQGLIVKH